MNAKNRTRGSWLAAGLTAVAFAACRLRTEQRSDIFGDPPVEGGAGFPGFADAVAAGDAREESTPSLPITCSDAGSPAEDAAPGQCA